ncbi:MAG: TlpA family protein disulfide reductase [Planctomycetes bacterium]|nr:TlpA family protein disulfide reductase [Planctomycetota bacterium]
MRITIDLLLIAFVGAAACAPRANNALVPLAFADDTNQLARALAPRGKPLVINHWATWCGPCCDELPYIAEVAAKFGGRADFVTVAWDNLSGDEPKDKIRARVDRVREKSNIRFLTIVSPPGISIVAKALDLPTEAVPQTFVISASGERLWSFQGEIVEDDDRKAFEEAIAKAADNK